MPYYSAKKIIKESIPFFMFLLIISLMTGNMLESFSENVLYRYVFLIIILPGYISAIGDTGSVFVSRLTSHLLLGEIDESFKPFRIMLANIISLLLISLTYLSAISIIAYLLAAILYDFAISLWTIMFVIIGSGMSAVILLMMSGTVATFVTYKYGLDPDNFTSPLMANLGDLLGSVLLLLFALIMF